MKTFFLFFGFFLFFIYCKEKKVAGTHLIVYHDVHELPIHETKTLVDEARMSNHMMCTGYLSYASIKESEDFSSEWAMIVYDSVTVIFDATPSSEWLIGFQKNMVDYSSSFKSSERGFSITTSLRPDSVLMKMQVWTEFPEYFNPYPPPPPPFVE